MKVKYTIFDNRSYLTAINIYPEEAKYEDFLSHHTGEIVEFLPATLIHPDRFLICDDDTKRFIKVNVSDCYKID